MVRVGPGLGVIHRGKHIVAAIRDLQGSVRPKRGGGIDAQYSGIVVGRPSHWCEPDVDVTLTFAVNPRRPNRSRRATAVTIRAFDGERIYLTGSDRFNEEGCYSDPFPEVLK
jgi:hypothetical protein